MFFRGQIYFSLRGQQTWKFPVGKDTAKKQLESGISAWLQDQFKKRGVLLAPIGEGLTEAASQIATNITDKALDVDPNVAPLDGVLESFVYGSAGGAQFSAAAIPGIVKNAYQRRKIKHDYKTASTEFDNIFRESAAEVKNTINSAISTGDIEVLNRVFSGLSKMEGMTDEQRLAAVNYALAKRAENVILQREEAELQDIILEAEQAIEQNINPKHDAIIGVRLSGEENQSPTQVINGYIVQREDGSIDYDASDQDIYIVDKDGNTQVKPIKLVEEVLEFIPAKEAQAQAAATMTAPILERRRNDEVRPYAEGEFVTIALGGVTPRFGEIVSVNENGTYTFVDKETMQEHNINPVDIINEDNLFDIDQGDDVVYVNKKGETKTGKVEDLYNFRNDGAVLVDGEKVPISNISPLSIQDKSASPVKTTENNSENGGVSTLEQNDLSNQAVQPKSDNAVLSRIEAILQSAPKQIDGDVDYDALLDENPSDFAELYEHEEGAEETRKELQAVMASINRKIESVTKALDKADSINKRKALKRSLKEFTAKREKLNEVLAKYSNKEISISETDEELETSASSEPSKPRTFGERLEALIGEITAQETTSELDNLVNIALSKGVSEEELANAYTPFDIIDLIEQFEHGREQQEQTGNTGTDRSEIQTNIRSRSNPKEIGGRIAERDRSGEDQGTTDASEGAEQIALEDASSILNNRENLLFSQNNIKENEVLESLPQRENGTLSDETGSMENESDSFQRGFEASVRDAQENKRSLSEREIAALAERYAKENKKWIPLNEQYKLGEPFPSGMENEVYYNEQEGSVYKVNNLSLNRNSILLFLERIDNHNQIFPDSKYELVGFSGFGSGNVYPVVKQDFVPNASFATYEDVTQYMHNIGFTPTGKQAEYANGEFVVSDLHPRNVLKDSDRDIHVVDAVVERQKTKNEQIEQAEAETNTNPTEAQKEGGNYKKGHVNVQGFDISIEQPKGSVRSGRDAAGNDWSVTMQNTYGYIRKTEGKDGDHIDVFIGPNPESSNVFVVDQVNPDGSFDEHKVMLGFDTIEEAQAAYLSNYSPGWQWKIQCTLTPCARQN